MSKQTSANPNIQRISKYPIEKKERKKMVYDKKSSTNRNNKQTKKERKTMERKKKVRQRTSANLSKKREKKKKNPHFCQQRPRSLQTGPRWRKVGNTAEDNPEGEAAAAAESGRRP